MSENIDLTGPVTIDLGSISDEPVSEGWHRVTIERADPKLSNKQQLPSIFVLSRVTDENDPDYNRTVIWNNMLEGDGMIFTKRAFEALGLPEQLDYPSYQALADDLIGREVDVKVKHNTYQGEKTANVNQWREASLDIEL